MQEKAFNMVMAEGSTRCCVCSLFDVPNPFSTFQPQLVSNRYEKLTQNQLNTPITSRSSKSDAKSVLPRTEELRVVVQRVFINLPHAAKEKTEIISCFSDDSDDEELVTCKSCAICVHRCELQLFMLPPCITLGVQRNVHVVITFILYTQHVMVSLETVLWFSGSVNDVRLVLAITKIAVFASYVEEP